LNRSHGVSELDTAGNYDFDLLIIGSGGSAFSAAIQAVSYSAKVGMIERGTIGGTCVNIGCVPSKTLLRAAEINHLARQNPFAGLQTSVAPVDLKTLVAHKNELVGELRQHKYVDLIDDYGFELIRGEARFVNEQTVEVDGRQITARNILISTGASPAVPNIPGLNDVDYLVSTTALELQEVPKRLAVIGSGYIAMELGQLFHNLGAEVTLMQRSEQIMKSYDPEISEAVTQAMTEKGIQLVTGVTFHRVEQDGAIKRVYITVNGEEQVIEAEQLLIATGRRPNTEALNLEAANVKVGDRGEVVVDEYLRTTNPRIYAAGDVTMGPQFVYVAAYEGWIVAENTVGGAEQKLDLRVVPGVTFTNPSIATVGLTEEQAKAEGFEVITSVLPLDAVPRALVNRETTGVFKLVADAKTRKVLGAHVVAENAGDVIYAATLMVKFGLTIEDLRGTMAPYLTMAEGLKLATLTFDKDVSKLSCCAG
jgi:mercuric reductase